MGVTACALEKPVSSPQDNKEICLERAARRGHSKDSFYKFRYKTLESSLNLDSSQLSLSKEAYDGYMRILAVDDEPSIRRLLREALELEGYEVATASTGKEALDEAVSFKPELTILDVMLPDMSGFEVARRMSEGDGVESVRSPIIFLTARDELLDKMRGLTLGDDYLTKPFSVEELGARIRAILRRSNLTALAKILRFADIELDDSLHEVKRGGRVLNLTATEYSLLRYFLLNPRLALTRKQILDQVWKYDFGGDARVLETYVSYLRKKLGKPEVIQTIRGLGYALRKAP